MASLEERWRELAKDADPNYWKVIETYYSEPQRHYHTLRHIEELFMHFDEHKESMQRPDLVAYAIFFHDIIYIPKHHNNEEMSAELFRQYGYKNNMRSKDIDRVIGLIALTKKHKTEAHMTPETYGHGDEHYFLDFDLGILASGDEDYDQYAAEIREEYSHLPVPEYLAGRIDVLRKLLSRPCLFATQVYREALEQRARENIEREIRQLEEEGSTLA
eukprot:Colp12_sorted_trinity150504_noHs@9731